jgi:phospholipid-binding lipoprotein MlaA
MLETTRVPLLALLCLSLLGCASLPPGAKRDPRDPFERMNRSIYSFNNGFDRAIAHPVATTYRKVVPQVVRTGVSNFMDNIDYPIVIINDFLQLKFKQFGQDTGRFLLNSTVGLGGLLDPATAAGLAKNDEDLGQTFGHWGAKPGPYIMIPILGPSDMRDGLGRIGDIWLSPRHYIKNDTVSWTLWGVEAIDVRYRLLDTDKLLEGVYDRYGFLRNAYLQRRQFLVTDGQVSGEQQQEEEELKEEQEILQQSGETPPPTDTKPTAPTPPTSPAEPQH